MHSFVHPPQSTKAQTQGTRLASDVCSPGSRLTEAVSGSAHLQQTGNW